MLAENACCFISRNLVKILDNRAQFWQNSCIRVYTTWKAYFRHKLYETRNFVRKVYVWCRFSQDSFSGLDVRDGWLRKFSKDPLLSSRDPKLDVSNEKSKSTYLYGHYSFSIGLLKLLIFFNSWSLGGLNEREIAQNPIKNYNGKNLGLKNYPSYTGTVEPQ